MTGLIWYLMLAFAILLLAAWLVRERPARDETEAETERELAGCVFDFRCLEIANRVFDPADYLWLRDELCFPQAADLLARHRKELALQWLQALRTSFNEFVRLPEPAAEDGPVPELSSWRLLGLTLRFQLLLGYALMVVRLFGPYHQLVPRLGWLQTLRELGAAGAREVVSSAPRTR